MDPSSLVKGIVNDIALDGIYGMSDDRLWDICGSKYGCSLDEGLKNAIWRWVASNPSVRVDDRTLFASEDLQWLALTGSPRADNPVGNLTFELLCLIAHSRKTGVSTVEASKITGQDLRSLFGRVQSLVNLGVVYRFPVIENGSSTNRMVFHTYADSHIVSDAAVDKQAISIKITEYCKAGIQGIRTTRDIVRDIGAELTSIKKPRRRPTVMGSIRELEAAGCVRRVTMVHPEYPDRHFSCVEFVRDFQAQHQSDGKENSAIATATDTIRAPTTVSGDADGEGDGDADEDEDADLDGEEDDEDGDGDAKSSLSFNSSLDLDKVVKSNDNSSVHANILTPLQNQICDAVQASGSQGISAMELTRYLTGNKYRKALGKYLDGLTAPPSSGPAGEIPQIGHLGLVKGVDFNRRVKFYRYFSKLVYSNPHKQPSEWGEFLPNPNTDPSMSLRRLDRRLTKPLPGVCSVIKTQDGTLKPVFHGDKEVKGDVVLKSGPVDSNSNGSGTGPVGPDGTTGKRKRGRPRKNEKKPSPVKKEEDVADEPEVTQPVTEQLKAKVEVPSDTDSGTIPVEKRSWIGGRPVDINQAEAPISRWLLQSCTDPNSAVHRQQPQFQPKESPRGKAQSQRTKAKDQDQDQIQAQAQDQAQAQAQDPDQDQARTPSSTTKPSATNGNAKSSRNEAASDGEGKSMDPSIGSLAHRQRVETLINIINENNGVVQGGAPLLEKFNEAVSGKYAVDRRTVHNVVDKLVREGKLQKIYMNVSTASGRHIMKFIVYDPSRIKDPDNNPIIAKAKVELMEGNREKHVLATRAALDAAKDAVRRLPRREMTDEQMKAYGPKSIQRAPNRILTTRSGKEPRTHREKTRFGPSAAEVLGVDGEGRLQSRVKRPARRAGNVAIKQQDPSELGDSSMPPISSGSGIMRSMVSERHRAGAAAISQNRRASVDVGSALEAPTGSEINLEKLARSVIVFRSLFAPMNGSNVDWKVIASCMDTSISSTEARKHWQEARSYLSEKDSGTRTADVVYRKTEQFETLFLESYRRDLVDFDPSQDPVSVIPGYVEWWQKVESENLLDRFAAEDEEAAAAANAAAPTKESRAVLRLSNLSLKNRKLEFSEIDPFASLQSQVSIVNAEKLLMNTSFGVPIGRTLVRLPRLTDNEMRLRAVIAADHGPSYSPERAARELMGLTNGETEASKAGLELKRVIQWGENDPEKVPTGRPFVLNEQVISALSVPKLDASVPQKLAEDMAFFVNSFESLEIPPTIDESDMICLIELCTFGLHGKTVKLRRIGEKFGLLSADYKSRGIDKQEFECDLVCDVIDNDSEDDNAPNEPGSFYIPSPMSSNHGRPWLWETRNLTSRSIWFKVAYRLLTMVHFRPGLPVDAIALSLRNALEYDETAAALKALTDGGALKWAPNGNGLLAVPNWFECLV